LVDGLTGGARDGDGDGVVDLDDLYSYMDSVLESGPEPFRRMAGTGSVGIARRLPEAVTPSTEPALERPVVISASAPREPSAKTPISGNVAALSFLDRVTSATHYSHQRVQAFREQVKDDGAVGIPTEISPTEFLQRVSLMRGNQLTLAGALLFGDDPGAAIATAIVQCARINGVDKGAAIAKRTIRGSVPEQIAAARDFVGEFAHRGEVPTTNDAVVQAVYEYPMVAIREIVANALVHRDYERVDACVHIRLFTNRIEIASPGTWTARE
jgi:hypothetical protein